ncbi:hypothetical protein [Cellulomonas marina]|uniref:Uncharacterized protein n=1 Tax=Cellulomonas marina TaxID=988821 RepID=A0A1I1A8U3_9CELL|nr:hypothetical protein [Cellulomonas marina]GIG29553.1 hypothetical protein Cma02nite_21530 [Cellulomonas marina]SFB32958.1 hypothetical protein SAMN05421867_11523 [Cellulomonas marina]
MSRDLGRALRELADDASAAAAPLPVDRVLARRRRRRAGRAAAVTAVTGVAVGAMVVTGLAFAGRPSTVAPADPTPTASAATGAPVCGDAAPTATPGGALVLDAPGTAVAGEPVRVAGTPASGTGVPAPSSVTLVALQGGAVVGTGDARGALGAAGSGTAARSGSEVRLGACASSGAPAGADPLPAGRYDLVLVVADPAGTLVSAPVPVELTAAAPAAPATTAAAPPPPTVEEAIAARPLQDPFVMRTDRRTALTSDAPASGDVLEDGDFFAMVRSFDEAAGTIDVDIAILYAGQDADDRARAASPGADPAEVYAPNGLEIVNDVERVRTLPLAPDVVVTGVCEPGGGGMELVATSLPALADGLDAADGCGEGGSSRLGSSWFWVDVRAGVVVQVVGQYTP